MERGNIINKIEKLLSKGNGAGVTEAESQSFILMAQNLITKYNIDQKELGHMKMGENVITDTSCEGSYTSWKCKLMSIISSNFRTRYLVQGKKFLVIGLETDAHITVTVYNYVSTYLEKRMHKLRRDYRKSGKSTYGISGSYCMGFLDGLNDQLKEQVDQNGWGLILVTPEAVVKKSTELSTGVRNTKNRLAVGEDDRMFLMGYNEGKSLDVNHKQLGVG